MASNDSFSNILLLICILVYLVNYVKYDLDEMIQQIKQTRFMISENNLLHLIHNQEAIYTAILSIQKTTKLPKELIRHITSYL